MNQLSDKWIKASIVGTIWAASEIVLGSFLHNLRIPFSSNFLTAIGIIILISTSYKWKEPGLFWRAGLICALMKTMSPSAVIFGPMIAIMSQAALLEIFTRILGKNVFGFVVGAMFAMTWNLFHKIMNFIIFYGFNIVNVYADLLTFAQKQLRVNVDLVWSPVLALALVYALFGVIAAIIGMKVGHKLVNQPAGIKRIDKGSLPSFFNQDKPSFNHSIPWFFIDVLLIITAFVLLNFTSWIWWSLSIAAITACWVIRYKRALRQLSSPRFWISFVVITMITAFVFTRIQSQNLADGLLTGVQMNFRAVVIILGFSVLGTELYNPKIREFFRTTRFRQLPLALEMSFESLPLMIVLVPEFRVIMRNPVMVIYQVISQIDFRLNEIKKNLSPAVIIITGSIGQGKTTQVQKLVDSLKARNIQVSGIFSPRIMEGETTVGYDVVDIESNRREPLLRISDEHHPNDIGKYSLSAGGLKCGTGALSRASNMNTSVVVIDEVGKLELDGRGWSAHVTELMNGSSLLVLAVRNIFTKQVIEKWDLKDCSVFEVKENLYVEICEMISRRLE
jgi:nucleoside-triphosphatase THEP1